jgi:hypothetical protein
MKQALHIFKKDVSYLRWDIGITLAATAVFTLTEIRHMAALGMFLPVAWWFLIARVIHAEALPSHRQFWLTRPYEWKSLLGAKLLFILVFVNLPLLTADAVIIHAVGFSVGREAAGLLWTQVLLLMAFVLPVTAFAALTSGLAELLLATLLVVIVIVLWLFTSLWMHWGLSPWFELEWVRTYSFVTQLAGAAAIILVWQYARRNSFATRRVAAAMVMVLLASNSLLPWAAAFALETHLSRRKAAPAAIRIDVDSGRKWLGHIYAAGQDQMVVELPLQISGIPVGTELKPNGLTVTLRAADGEKWVVNQPPPDSFDFKAGIPSLRATMGGAFYEKVKDQPLQFRGTLFFTLYGTKGSTPIQVNGRSVAVNRVGVCSARAHLLLCDLAFRPPSDLVTVRTWEEDAHRGTQVIKESPFPSSYSPFPADFNVNPIYQSLVSPHGGTITAADVQELEPLEHVERDFDIKGVRLNDFAASFRPAR